MKCKPFKAVALRMYLVHVPLRKFKLSMNFYVKVGLDGQVYPSRII